MGSRFLSRLVATAVLAAPATAAAADGAAGDTARGSELRLEAALTRGREQGFRPTLSGPGAELRWSRLLLASPEPSVDVLRTQSWGELSLLADHDRDLGRPLDPWSSLGAMVPSLATAAGSIVSGGVVLMERGPEGAPVRRHRLRAYFRRGGLNIVWRMEF